MATQVEGSARVGRVRLSVLAGAVGAISLVAFAVVLVVVGEKSAGCGDRLPAGECAAALRIAHHQAVRLAPRHTDLNRNGWPANIRVVTAWERGGTVEQPNIGPACRSGRLVTVDLIGAFTIVVSPPPGATHTSVRDVRVEIDAATRRACLLSVRSGHATVAAATVLFRRD